MKSKLKPATAISFLTAAAVFLVSPTESWAVALLRALMAFAAIFLWSSLGLIILSKIASKGGASASGSGDIPQPTGSGEGRFVDLSKTSLDRAKLMDMLR